MEKKRLTIVLTLTVMIIGSTVGVYLWLSDSIMENYWRSQLESATDAQVPPLMAEIAQRDEDGVALLVESLGSPREIVARKAKEMLVALLAHWELLDGPQRMARLERLASQLAARVETFPPAARDDAVDLVRKILSWRFNDRWTDGMPVLVHCDRVLTSVPARPVATFGGGTDQDVGAIDGSADPTITASVPADLSDREAQLLEMFQGLGSGMPGLEATIPIDARPTERATDSRGAAVPGSTDSALFSGFGTASRPGIVDLAPATDTTAKPIPAPALISISPTDRLRAARQQTLQPADAVDDTTEDASNRLVGIDSWNLMRRLGDEDAAFVSLIKAELTRRGFGQLHFELAARLFHNDPYIRAELARMLPRMHSVRATDWLLRLAEDLNAEVRYQALSTLATSSDPVLLEQVQRMARTDQETRIRLLAQKIDDRLRR